jgi:mannose/fructose/N-acetylgalactosamine-specific phosphotransferase system component IIC
MPSMQEPGGLSEADKKRIIEEELLRNHVRQTMQLRELQEMEEAESQENAGAFKRILIYIGVAFFLIVIIIAVVVQQSSQASMNRMVNSAPAATAPRR